MKKILACLLFMFLTAELLFMAAPEAAAYEPGDPYSPDLSELIRDADHRTYVETLPTIICAPTPACGRLCGRDSAPCSCLRAVPTI